MPRSQPRSAALLRVLTVVVAVAAAIAAILELWLTAGLLLVAALAMLVVAHVRYGPPPGDPV
jgi:hypothetical protein